MSEPTQSETAAVNVPVYLQQLIDEIAVREGFAVGYTTKFESGSNVGDGFQAVMLRAVIDGRRSQHDNEQLHLICKVPPTAEMRRQFAVPSFRQEVFAYEKLLPKLVELQKSKQISATDGFFSFPKSYGTYSNEETNDFAIVLEDLRQRGFRMWNKFRPIDFAHVKLALSELGKYHALSFALREEHPDVLKDFAQNCVGMFKSFQEIPQIQEFYENAFNRAIDVLTDDEGVLIDKMETVRDHCMAILGEVTDASLAEPFAVLNHGDFWNNNMMFDYTSESSETAQSVCVIDWQMTQYCSAATDLAYFLYSSTERTLREEHWDDMLAVYHGSLTKLLKQLGHDAEKLFKFTDLIDQMQNFAIYGIILAPVLVQVVTVKPDDIPEMDSLTIESMKTFEFGGKGPSLTYNVRIHDVMTDFDSRGYFESDCNTGLL